MLSFYGGKSGKDFYIKQIFKNKVSLQEDLNQEKTSPVEIGELVLISYGLLSDESYEINKQEDLNRFQKTYNATLWRKVYTEIEYDNSELESFYLSGNKGLGYQLLNSFVGETPKISIEHEIKNPGAENGTAPEVYLDNSDPSNVIINFKLGELWNLKMGQVTVLGANENPTAEMLIAEDQKTKIINLGLPRANALNIIKSYDIIGTSENDTVDIVGSLLEQPNYYGKKPGEDELIAINYTNENDVTISYWYFCVDEKWSRLIITGGVAGIIENFYKPEGNEGQSYSISYINDLINNENILNENEKIYKTYSAKYLETNFQPQIVWKNLLN